MSTRRTRIQNVQGRVGVLIEEQADQRLCSAVIINGDHEIDVAGESRLGSHRDRIDASGSASSPAYPLTASAADLSAWW
jgi:hypothetical protein